MVDFNKLLKDMKKGPRKPLGWSAGKESPKREKKDRKPPSATNTPGCFSSSLSLTGDQDRAALAIEEWLRDKSSPMFTLAGFAGTGKTTLMGHIIANLKDPFCVAAPTGKAASVLRSKIKGLQVRTLHQLLYAPQGTSFHELERLERELEAAKAAEQPIAAIALKLKEEKERLRAEKVRFNVNTSPELHPGKLLIVDEASMVSRSMMNDILETDVKVLFVGDDGQLPPVKDESWFIGHEHNAKLTTVMRQALESPIIRFSMQVRAGEVNFEDFKEGDCVITSKDNLTTEDWLGADQIITGSNASRRRINRFYRKQLGYNRSVLPVAGDKMICLKNDHYKIPPWINGVQFRATEDVQDFDNDVMLYLTCDYEGLEQQVMFYDYHTRAHYVEGLEEDPREMRQGLFEADYAYAITVHKSQGSEWPFVIIADDEMQKAQREFRKRWLYTAITRAKSRLILAR